MTDKEANLMPEQWAYFERSGAAIGPAVSRHSPKPTLFTRNQAKKVNGFTSKVRVFTIRCERRHVSDRKGFFGRQRSRRPLGQATFEFHSVRNITPADEPKLNIGFRTGNKPEA